MNINIDGFVKATVIFLKSCFQLSIMVIIYSLNIEPFREIKSADGEAVKQSEEKNKKRKHMAETKEQLILNVIFLIMHVNITEVLS